MRIGLGLVLAMGALCGCATQTDYRSKGEGAVHLSRRPPADVRDCLVERAGRSRLLGLPVAPPVVTPYRSGFIVAWPNIGQRPFIDVMPDGEGSRVILHRSATGLPPNLDQLVAACLG